MIDIYLLEQFITFYECGTLVAAAEKLYISQPALSHSMQKLEKLFGVPLFERQKNKITFNENGIHAVEYAAKLIQMEKEMIKEVQTFAMSNQSISFGSCAITPINELSPILSELYPEMTVHSVLSSEAELLDGLKKDIFHMLVLTHPLEDQAYFSEKWSEECLFVTLPLNHLLSKHTGIFLYELDGYHMLLFSPTGFWEDLIKEKMPTTNFITHNEYDVLHELTKSSAFLTFKTNHTMNLNEQVKNRTVIPILDPEASVTYYCICKQKYKQKFAKFFARLKE